MVISQQPCYGQVADDFSDGDLTINPAWSGDAGSWTDTLGKLRSNDTSASSKFYLSTPSALVANTQWEWWDSLQFNTSSANYIDVYLLSDSSNLKASSFNGYFVRIGNTSDEISLYKRAGTVITEIIDGADGLLNSSNNVMRVKVIRDAVNTWTLQRDSTGTGNNFVTEGTITDGSFTSGSYFGIAIQQSTASFFKKHWFDDIYVGPVTGDTVAPALVALTVISSSQLDVKFSETVSITSSENEANYIVNNSIGNPFQATRDASDSSIVHLIFSAAFASGVTHNLTVSGIEDNNSNIMVTTSQNFTWFVAVPAVYKDVVINEIFADPSPQIGLPNAEFIEIYNKSNKTFDLAGWEFSDGTSTATFPGYYLFPDSFLILCSSANAALFTAYGSTAGLTSFPSLNNTSDNLTLKDGSGLLVDAVSYDTSWYHDDVKKDGGYTLEMINPNNPCTSQSNWTATEDSTGGTPGEINSVYDTTPDLQPPSVESINIVSPTMVELSFSEAMDSLSLAAGTYIIDNGLSVSGVSVVPGDYTIVSLTLATSIDTAIIYTLSVSNVYDCSGNSIGNEDSIQFVIGYQPAAGDLIINEIFADPTPQLGLPDAEFVEIYNKSNKFLEIGNCILSGATFPQGTAIPPNSHLILTGTTQAPLLASFGTVVPMGNWSTTFLTNSGKELLLSLGAAEIDKVYYDISWYKDIAKDDGGWSLERINPDHPCSGADNWKASLDASGGTPGKINSVFSNAPDTMAPSIAGVTIISSTQVQINFSEGMDLASLNTNYTITNGGITVVSAQPVGPPYTSVILYLSPALDSATVYSGNIFYVADCAGNAISNQPFSFGIGVNPAKFDIIINEIYPDPDATVSSLPEIEFVELYNNTPKAIRLDKCTITDGSSNAVLYNEVLLPGNYLILCPASNVSDYSGYGKVLGLSSFPALNNTGDYLALTDAIGNTIHEINYTDDWYADENKKSGGWTLELIDPGNPCGEASNWKASNDPQGGTPGKVNSVKGSNPDVTAPGIISAYAANPSTVMVYFNEITDSLSIVNGNYVINNGIVISSVFALDKKTVQLNLSSALQPKIMYTVTAGGMMDCTGNITSSSSAGFSLTETGEPGDIIINEILFNPRTGGSDFIEIYNRSQKVINLQDWVLANIANDSISNRKIISSVPQVIFPEEYLVFSKDTANVRKEYPLGKSERYYLLASMPNYNDDSGTVVIINNQNVVADEFSYTEDLHFALIKDNEGISLERIDFDRPSADITNWHSASEAVGWATPGYRNSQYNSAEGDGSQVSVEPEIFSPDNDGINDIVNIHYKFETPGQVATVVIYDAKGRLIRTVAKNSLLGNEGTFSWDGISDSREKARIGIYLIWFETFDLNGNVKHYKKTCVLAGRLN